jgi:hypothetical protein
MSEHKITAEEWTRCEEALTGLTGGVGLLFNMWDAAAHGGVFDKKWTAGGLHFLAQSMQREIDTLKDLLSFAEAKPRFQADDDCEAS